ncbi:unnamed protein product, partial [Porites evermanni]
FVPTENTNELGLFEGDIILTPAQRFAVDMGLDLNDGFTRGSSAYSRRQWPNGVVPYTFDPTICMCRPSGRVLHRFGLKTGIHFAHFGLESGMVFEVTTRVCSSYVGRISGKQIINLARGCWQMGTVAHEMAHALGFYHEQSRPDRDDYVTIRTENIKAGKNVVNFKKQSSYSVDSLGTPYDYGSIMHYGTSYFSKNGQPTIVVKKPGVRPYNAQIGQRKGPSAIDVKQMNLLYKCKNTGSGVPCVDTYDSCAKYTKYCTTHSFMKKNCKKTCNLC